MKRIVLASKSASRAALLAGARVAFEAVDSGVDEAKLKARLLDEGAGPAKIAGELAEAKALAVSLRMPDAIVIGADQTLELDGLLFDKAASLSEARERLASLRGQRHELHSAVAAAEGGRVVWRVSESPALTMRDFSDTYLDGYLARNGVTLLGSVGCYMLEGEGAQLFEAIDGDYFAVLGLPLLPLLAFLRREGALTA
ncbi:MAG TPA: Maf family protein [Caulobacteraceae bacterium]|nr:Maf family protein [Caulobacteraceae bacterium]